MNSAIVSTLPEMNQPDARYVTVTPDIARQWLALNTSNRHLKQNAIASFVQDMREGRWGMNGEAIKFAGPFHAPTKLLDGQNRLYAIVKAKVSVQMLVVFNVDESLQITMDSGTKRTVADNLLIRGEKNTVAVSSAASLALRVARGGRFIDGGNIGSTNAAIQEFIYENPRLFDSASIAARYSRKADVPASLVGYTHFVFSEIDQNDADEFWRAAAEKIGLAAGDPVLTLTNWFAENRRSGKTIRNTTALSAIYRAWNYRRQGKPLTVIRSSVSIPEPR